MRTRDLEDEAARLIRHAATDRLPVDAGVIGTVAGLIREAWDRGQWEIRELAEAELRELASMGAQSAALADPDEVQAIREFLKRLETYGA